MSTDPLIRSAALLAQGSDNVVFLDASVLLPGQAGDLWADFEAMRLPRARRFDIEEFSDHATDLPHMVPTAGAFAKGMDRLGITRDDRIVFYDRQGSVGACRGWWLAKLFGHAEAYVLDGGLALFAEEGGTIETGMPHAPEPTYGYRTRTDYAAIAGARDVLHALGDSEVLILDARSPARFLAKAPEPRPGVRGGHIPGAVNLPYALLLDARGCFLDPAALQSCFRSEGWDCQHVITSCGSGLTAATLTVGLAVAGLPFGRLYDGSWAEWGADPSLPIATF